MRSSALCATFNRKSTWVMVSPNACKLEACERRPTVKPRSTTRPASVVDSLPEASWRCRSSSWARMSSSDCIVRDEREPTPEMRMDVLLGVLYVHQSLEHLFHGRGNACIGGVGVLQTEQVGHFLVDIDSGNVIETRFQRIEHDRLSVLEPRRRICGL